MDVIGRIYKKNKTLFIYPDGGLGNRLNCIYSGIYWQKRLGMKMKILWEVDLACCIRYEKLFSPIPGVQVKTVYTLPLKKKKALCSLSGRFIISCLKNKPTYFSSEATRDLFANGGEEAIERMIMERSGHCIKAFSAFADWEHISEVVNCLKPAERIKKQVDEIMNPYKEHISIGIHIRRTDNVRAIQNSPLSVFTDQMKRILKENPDTRFYLATDDESVEREFSDEFPLIRYKKFSGEKSRKTETGMMDAYVDMLCLSRCDRIYGSFGSTFSKMAAMIGGKECIVLQKATSQD